MLGIPVDTAKLFSDDDQDYELWLGTVVELVNETNRREAARAKAQRG